METLLQDFRYAARTLCRSPGFTAVAVLTLALGIGANTTMFGVLDALFLSPPPEVHEPDRVKRIYIVRDEGNMQSPGGGPGSYPDYRDLRAGARSFSGVAGQFSPRDMSLGRGESAEQITGAIVTGGYFPTLGTRPARGRFFGPAEDSIPAAPVAVVSHAFWRNRFEGSPEAIGREIFLEGKVYTVVGVAPEHFHGIDNEPTDVWVPTAIAQGEDFLTNRNFIGLRLFGRLAPGSPVERATAEAAAVLRNAAESAEHLDPTPRVILASVKEALGPHRSQTATTALWLALVTGIVLLIACANVANLLLARATRRRREIGIRLALGAGPARLIGQLLTESMVLALLGGAAAVLVTAWSASLIRLFPLPPIPSLIDGRMLAFTFGASVLTGVLFGLLPALQASRVSLVPALKDGSPSGGPSRSRARLALLVGQMALSLVLLIGAGLLVRSAMEAQSVNSGMDVDRLLYVSVDLGDASYEAPAQEAFMTRALERLRALPGIARADLAQYAPLGGNAYAMRVEVPGLESRPEFEGGGPYVNFVGPDFFQTVGTPVLRGRAFTETDREGGPPVVVVNQRMADLYWPAGDALGGCMQIGDDACTEVVGVTQNIKHRLLEEAIPNYYIPVAQQAGRGAWSSKTIILRTRGEPSAMIGEVQRAVQGLDPNLPFVSVLPATELLGPALQPFRLGATLFSLFGVLALVLAAIGLYGLVAFTVAQQTHEIGVRIALGAGRGDVLRLVVSRAMAFTLVGVGIGMAGAVGVTRFMQSLLYGVDTLDAVTFVAVPFLLITVALTASYLPARRATRVDPMVALRAE
jgi:predicted permease